MAGGTHHKRKRKLALALLAGGALLMAACQNDTSADHTVTTLHVAAPGAASTASTAPGTAATTIAPTTSTTATTSAPTTALTGVEGIEVGPGPEASYTVEPQPPQGSCHYTYIGAFPLPDPHCTPGAVNPQVTQADIGTTICRSGYTSTIRPPESVTEPEKIASAEAYSYTGSLHVAEYDHLISLELGGDPNDPANLWVEPNDRPGATSTSNTKDVLENRLNDLVCSGQLTLAQAQTDIATNWVSAYQQYVAAPTASPAAPAAVPAAPTAPTTTAAAPPPPPPSAAAPPPPAAPVAAVHPGAFCSPQGATGTTVDGTPMICTTSATDSRDRWRSQQG